jgi:2'-5' RNA ligase
VTVVIQEHTFIGIPISKKMAAIFEEVQKTYQLSNYYRKTVNKEDFHLTLLFLGSWQTEKRVQLWERLQSRIASNPRFSLTFSMLGFFGVASQPRVFYVGIETENQLIQLQTLVQSEAELLGFPKSHRNYHPHLTLAKKWRDMSKTKPNVWNFPVSITKKNQLIDRINLYKISPSKETMYEVV